MPGFTSSAAPGAMSRYEYNKTEDSTKDHGDEAEVFEEYLRHKGLKFTAARRQLLDRIFEMHDHFTADQLLDRLRSNDLRVSKATVYRTLNVMLDSGLLASHDFGEGALYYEHTYGHAPHEHMFCLACKKIIEFKSPEIDTRLRDVASELSFFRVSHSLKVFGLCEGCARDPKLKARFAER